MYVLNFVSSKSRKEKRNEKAAESSGRSEEILSPIKRDESRERVQYVLTVEEE